MRTAIAIVIGLVLLAIVVAVALKPRPPARSQVIIGFVVVWFLVGAVDVYFGVSAGYPLGEELLIHLVVFAVPAVAAFVAAKRLPAAR